MVYTIITSKTTFKRIKRHANKYKQNIQTGCPHSIDYILNPSAKNLKNDWENHFKTLNATTTIPSEVGQSRLLYLRGQYILIHDYFTNPQFVNHIINNYEKLDEKKFKGGIKLHSVRQVRKEQRAVVPFYNNGTSPNSGVFSRVYTKTRFPYQVIDKALRNPYIHIGKNSFYYIVHKENLPVNSYAYYIVLKPKNKKGVRDLILHYSVDEEMKQKEGSIKGWNELTLAKKISDLGNVKKEVVPF